MKTALQLYSNPNPRTFTTGCNGVDSFLGGGIPMQGLTEICGESGAGKTQMCMQLLLTAQRSLERHGLNGKTLFLSCEGLFPIRRLQELSMHVAAVEIEHENAAAAAAAAAAATATPSAATATNTNPPPSVTLPPDPSLVRQRAQLLVDNILISHIDDAEQLMDVMTITLPMELRRGAVKLVIVDSITAVCRGHFDNSLAGLSDRADVLVSLASYMKQMSDRYNCAFVVVNQVSACFQMGQKSCSDMASSWIPNGQEPPPEVPKSRKSRRRNREGESGADEEEEHMQFHVPRAVRLPKFTPALGITWTTCINTRIMLTRGNGNEDDDGFLRRRDMRLLLSSKYTCGTLCHYHVTEQGIKRVADEML
jgi:RecA/RadA recombinase